ncbi:ABC transporter ATP-binding protein [Petroclostridium sp. X23]|uniref:ABC transporter ATP-binding protein n=1 Tax=Petroclostridium sp. X23 TaxID=3045146 RepID=UPI0024AD5D84|nr:ABC transporter ATP-binding protein [Petroclostridium sp. X23]WHH58005.1 ABC transporter ATP-binding protein [Petroclostridium sp. X23]
MNPVLKLENITKRFSGLVAVNNLSLEMPKNCIHALIGPNGSGKTTTVNMITGVLPASEGNIFYNDAKISGKPLFQIARLGIGRTFQNLKLFGSMSVLENLMVGGHQLTKAGLLRFLVDLKGEKREETLLKERAEEVLEQIGLVNLRNEKVKNLSYGRQKMTELGRALMMKPDLLILDEPAAGLNPSERKEFVDILLKTHSRGIDLFLIEHNMDVVMNISKKITVLNFGAKIAEGTPKEIQNNDQVIKAYLGNKYTPVKTEKTEE